MTVELTTSEALRAVDGSLLQPGALELVGAAIDSRAVRPGQAFVAIAGDRFDGHDYCQQAIAAGAGVLVVERLAAEVPAGVAVIQVQSTRLALGQLARAWRRKVAPVTVAITGSVGKTTTKELCRGLLSQLGETHSNPGNFNNDIGLPLTVLSMPGSTRYLVLEMGMNAPGEIDYLTGLAEPMVGVVTCVAPVHLEGLGSIEAIARAKGELPRGLSDGAWVVVPGDEPLLQPSLEAIPVERQVRFGETATDEVRLVSVEAQGQSGSRVVLALRSEEVEFTLPLVGRHNARNAAAAAAAAMVLGLEPGRIAEGLGRVPTELGHRSTVRAVGDWQVFDDCYNANPVAMKAALDTLIQLRAPGSEAVAVLGDMLELGDDSELFHLEVGRHAAAVGLDLLVTVGALGGAIAEGALEAGMPADRVSTASSPEEAAARVRRSAPSGAWVLVKASRGVRLETVIDGLGARKGQGEEDG